MITDARWLLIPYALNIVILVPVCHAMLTGGGLAGGASSIFEGKVADSAGLRLMVGSLWLSILLASIAGLRWPAFFAPIVLVQIVYKAVWLGAFVLPLWWVDKPYPVGISVVFFAIVAGYPIALWLATR